ncbi:MAG: hypothetical protein P8013_03045 [Candidatus Sulfobium sp.]|jgi:hypothetical protein
MKRFIDRLISEPERIYILALVCAVALTGFLKLLKVFLDIRSKHDFALEYFDRLDEYIDKRGDDAETYAWLIKRSNRMQKQIISEPFFAARGSSGESSHYESPPVIINMLPELRSALHEGILARGSVAVQYGSTLLRELLRHIGIVEDVRKEQAARLRNPFVWLREGVRFFIELPAHLLSWLGVMSEKTVRKVVRGVVVRAFAVFVTAVVLIGAAIVVSLGWPYLKGLVVELIKWARHFRLT